MTVEVDRPWIGPRGQVMRRLELHLTYHCPERCSFCSEAHRMQRFDTFPVTFARVATVLRTQANRGVEAVHLTGGEPTIHPQFVDVLRLAKKLGMRTSVGTIGTMLSREPFAQEAMPLLDEALFSLHGPTAEIHDALAGRRGSFETVTSAIRTCTRLSPAFMAFVNTVVTTKNVEHLGATVALARDLGAKLIVVSNLTPEGAGADNYDTLACSLEALSRTLPALRAIAEPAILRVFGVPMCVLGDSWTCSNDLHWDPRVTVEWAAGDGFVEFAPIYSWAPNRRRVHPPVCASCTRKGQCAGVFDLYAERRPLDALRAYG